MSTTIFCIIFPLIFLAVSTMVFSGSIDDSAIPTHMETIGCPMPTIEGYPNNMGTYNYASVGNQTTLLDCTAIHTLDGVDYYYGSPATIVGWAFFVGDWLSVGIEKAQAVFGIASVYLSATIPIDLITEVPPIAIPYGFIFLLEGYGLYNMLHPLKR